MKILFIFALLANIVFFLWELNSGKFNKPVPIEVSSSKEILLVSELTANNSFLPSKNSKQQINIEISTEKIDSVIDKVDLAETDNDEQSFDNQIAMTHEPGHTSELTVNNSLLDSINSKQQIKIEISEERIDPVLDKVDSVEIEDDEQKYVVSQIALAHGHESNHKSFSKPMKEIGIIVTPGNLENRLSPSSEIALNQLKNSQTNLLDSANKKPVIKTKNESDSFDSVKLETSLSIKEDSRILSTNATGLESEKNCFEVGVFESINSVNVWSRQNITHPDSFSKVYKEVKKISSYLVYFSAAESYQKSQENVSMLKQKGITDYWLFRKGALKGGISLGLFSKESRALIVQEKFIRMGINTEIKTRYTQKNVLYARVLSDDYGLRNKIKILAKQQIIDCGK